MAWSLTLLLCAPTAEAANQEATAKAEAVAEASDLARGYNPADGPATTSTSRWPMRWHPAHCAHRRLEPVGQLAVFLGPLAGWKPPA